MLLGSALLRSRPAAERWFLILASAWFYGQWSWKYLILIYLTISVDFVLGRLMYARITPGRALAISLAVNLSILGFFKYANFVLESVEPILSWAGLLNSVQPLELLLPVGISFYTFQSLSYTIDRYRGNLKARQSFRDYALFVSFFPQLVAGPIVRASEFFQQLDRDRKVDFLACQTGFILISVGLVKKVVFADNLALIADPVFSDPASATPLMTLLGVYAFAFQIYFDFSGYTDIAIGVARLMGFKFPTNFNHPYVALSIKDFWRRWHITLSHWLRDYLYISLGGSRGAGWLTARNLMLTMLLGGLWHGASWNFVFWGGLHGLYLVTERFVLERFELWRNPNGIPMRFMRWLLCFHLVCVAWVFFRAPDFSSAGMMFANIADLSELGRSQLGGLSMQQVWLLAALPAMHWAFAKGRVIERLQSCSTLPFVTAQVVLILTLALFAPGQDIPFIYFQF